MARLWLVAFALATLPLHAQDVDPAKAGLDPAKIAALRAKMQEFVEQGVVSGSVTLVGRKGHVGSLEAVGHADLEEKVPMKADTIFRIASMTKPITAIAILMLEDEGKLSTEDPVEKHLPEFKGQMLVQEKTADRVVLVKPPRPITLRDLLTHTSGLPGSPPPGIGDLYSKRHKSLAEAVMAFSQRPLDFPPGSKWSYCNTGIDTLGRVVEVCSGKSFEAFLEERLFAPLGMKDSFFYPPEDKHGRIAGLYKQEKGKLVKVPSFIGDVAKGRYPIPAGGLYSTAGDIAKVCQMMLNRGESGGKRYLSEAAVERMTKNQMGEIGGGFVKGMCFGFGWAVVREPQGITETLSAGSYGHGGAFGTQYWIDPGKKMYFILMIQRTGLPNADGSELRRALQSIAAAAVAE